MRKDLLPTTFDAKLAKIVEEAGEFLQAYGKYIRHGATPTDPLTGISYDNIKDMKAELEDLKSSIERLNED